MTGAIGVMRGAWGRCLEIRCFAKENRPGDRRGG
jgi:hypothetical protein